MNQAKGSIRPVKFIIDSGIDIPPSIEKSNLIGVIPCTICIDGQEFRDRIDLKRDDFYKQLIRSPQVQVTTKAPSVDDYARIFRDALNLGQTIISFSLSAALSSAYDNATAARQKFSPAEQDFIHLFDTGNISAGSGLLVLKALEWKAEGVSPAEMLKRLADVRPRLVSLGYIESLERLFKSTRGSSLLIRLAFAMGFTPLLSLRRGRIVYSGLFRRSPDIQVELVRRFLSRLDRRRSWSIGIIYSEDAKVGNWIEGEIKLCGIALDYYFKLQCTSVLAAHTHPGAICLFAMPGS